MRNLTHITKNEVKKAGIETLRLYIRQNTFYDQPHIEKASDYLTTDELKRLNRNFQKHQHYQVTLLIEFGFRTMLRYSDKSRFTLENNFIKQRQTRLK